jgi:two-component system, chemotaxis family, CheB/CheR fusion protein
MTTANSESQKTRRRRRHDDGAPDTHNEQAPIQQDASAAKVSTMPAAPPDGNEAKAAESFPVVGIGASAGGLAALEQFLTNMPSDPNMALVLVQHLDPDRKTILGDLTRRFTAMQVYEVEDGMTVEPNCTYVIRPNKDMILEDGKLRLTDPLAPRGLRLPIDHFFRSLGQDQGDRAICVILSGTGTDGTLGLKAVKEAGGMVMVQSPESAKYDGMPRSAINTGLVDYILTPGDMPSQIVSYVQRSFRSLPVKEAPPRERISDPLQRIFVLLRAQSGQDFSQYKYNTIYRRIERRMAVHNIDRLEAYVRFLQQYPSELTTLYKELLIGVTNFFRDPEAWVALETRVIPEIFAIKKPGETVRVWVPGCSTGEEACSIGMILSEAMTNLRQEYRVQIFATDVDADAIGKARAGVYPESIAVDVSAERLARFFTQENTSYRVKKRIRDMVVFAEQNVAQDPPFSHVDLVSCRNLLIYMGGELQRRVLPLLHYALVPNGFLFLGSSETVTDASDLFTAVDRKWKIFARRPGLMTQRAAMDFGRAAVIAGAALRREEAVKAEEKPDLRSMVEQAMLNQYSPAAVVINENGDVLYVHGRTGRYLEPAPGEASMNVLRMARDGIRLELATGLRKAVQEHQRVEHRGLLIRADGAEHLVSLSIQPLSAPGVMPSLVLIVFEPVAEPPAEAKSQAPVTAKDDERIAGLERELHAKSDYLQTMIEELETSNEELKSTNEELQSANEELQSTNEELETSKEELQSVNEELITVNAELQKKIEELSRANDDLDNLLASTGIGTIFVDDQLRIERFTPAATDIINVIQTDIGRPVSHIASNLEGNQTLVQDVATVLRTLVRHEAEVQTRDGRWYSMRIQPYKTLANVIEGAVLTFVEITELKKVQSALSVWQRLRMEGLDDALLILDAHGRILDCNEVALQRYGYPREEFLEMVNADLVEPPHYSTMRAALQEVWQGGSQVIESVHCARNGTPIPVQIHAQRVEYHGQPTIFLVARDLTGAKRETASHLANEERLQRLAALMQDAAEPIVVRDLYGALVVWNGAAARAYGWNEHEGLADGGNGPLPPNLRECEGQAFEDARGGRPLTPFECERATRDGRSVRVAALPLALLDGDGKPYAVATVETAVVD